MLTIQFSHSINFLSISDQMCVCCFSLALYYNSLTLTCSNINLSCVFFLHSFQMHGIRSIWSSFNAPRVVVIVGYSICLFSFSCSSLVSTKTFNIYGNSKIWPKHIRYDLRWKKKITKKQCHSECKSSSSVLQTWLLQSFWLTPYISVASPLYNIYSHELKWETHSAHEENDDDDGSSSSSNTSISSSGGGDGNGNGNDHEQKEKITLFFVLHRSLLHGESFYLSHSVYIDEERNENFWISKNRSEQKSSTSKKAKNERNTHTIYTTPSLNAMTMENLRISTNTKFYGVYASNEVKRRNNKLP